MISMIELWAQDNLGLDDTGEIKDVQVEILKDRKVAIPPAQRIFNKIPPRPFEPIIPSADYPTTSLNFPIGEYQPKINMLKIKNEEISKISGNYLSASLGNYASYFGEASISSKRNKKGLLGLHAFSRTFGKGPVDGKYSGASNTDVNLYGKRVGSFYTITGNGNWSYRKTNFYGYESLNRPSDINSIRQTFNYFNLKGSINNTENGDFNFKGLVNYSVMKDNYSAYESEVYAKFKTDIATTETNKILLHADYSFINRKGEIIPNSNRHLVHFSSAYYFNPIDNISVIAGLNMAFSVDNYEESKTFHVYPNIKVNANITSSIQAFVVLTGNIDKVNLHTITKENLWVDKNIAILNTNRELEIIGGVNGKLSSRVSVNAGVSYSKLSQFYNFARSYDSDILPPNPLFRFGKFELLYDGNTKITNPYLSILYNFNQVGEFIFRGDYYFYNTKDLIDVYHRPSYKLVFDAKYFLFKKILLTSSFFAQGGINGIVNRGHIIKLDPALDFSIKSRYFLSDNISLFVELNNIFNNNYQSFIGYSVRGFQICGGVSWSF